MIANSVPLPMPGETCERYMIRAHKQSAKLIPDPHKRTALIFQAWNTHAEPDLPEQVARETFSPEKYTRQHAVCVFGEHDTTDESGKPRSYGLRELAGIVRNCNDRIADVGAFAAISDGHTTNPGDPNPANPRVLGYAGPYRLGMIGRKNPRWAIFSDEFHRNDCADELAEKQRRSVELWTFDKTGRSHFDPIAALGSEAPRLTLPAKFHQFEQQGARCERYSIAAPALAGKGSTFLTKFAEGEGTTMALSDQDLAQITGAIMELPAMQWVQEQMGGGGGDDDAEQFSRKRKNSIKYETDEEPEIDEELPTGDDDLADLNDLIDDLPEEEEEPSRFGAGAMQYSQRQQPTGVSVQKYQQLRTSHARLVQHTKRQNDRLAALERERTDAQRTQALAQLANDFPQVVELAEEQSRCLYSHGANMSNAEFKAHLATVERYAQRAAAPSRMTIPQGELPYRQPVGNGPQVRDDAYELKCSELATKICTDAMDRGEMIDWETGYAQAEQKLAGAGAS